MESEEKSEVFPSRELSSYYNVDIQELSHSLSRFKDVLENYTRNAYEGIRENSVEKTPSCTEQSIEETLKGTEDLKNSVEEDQQDEESGTKRRVRKNFFIFYFKK